MLVAGGAHGGNTGFGHLPMLLTGGGGRLGEASIRVMIPFCVAVKFALVLTSIIVLTGIGGEIARGEEIDIGIRKPVPVALGLVIIVRKTTRARQAVLIICAD